MNAKTLIPTLLLLLAGCATAAQSIDLESPLPMRSKGTLEVKMEDERNTSIALRVQDLAKPTSIGAREYVAWAIPLQLDEAPRRVGALALDDGAHGSLDATVALTDFWLIITAEPLPLQRAPMGAQIFSAEITRVEPDSAG